MASDIVNVLTIDLEDYYMVSALESVVKREDWYKYESRIERNTHRLLDIMNGSLRTPHSELRFGLPSSASVGLLKDILFLSKKSSVGVTKSHATATIINWFIT